jgi:hypothetical protein
MTDEKRQQSENLLSKWTNYFHTILSLIEDHPLY